MVKLTQNECTSDDNGVPICYNQKLTCEIIDGVRTEQFEVCQECRLDLEDIGYESLCEENKQLKTAMTEMEANAKRATEDLEEARSMVADITAERDNFLAERNREQQPETEILPPTRRS